MNITKKSFIICLIMLILSLPNYSFSQYDFSDDYGADGKKISIDVKGMDVVEVLKMLASKGSLNIVVGSNVRGKVTMFLKDVNVRDAFDLILVANQLAKDERSGIIYVMTERDYAQIYGKEYDDQKEAKIIKLRYASAVEVGKVLTQIKTKVGRIITDESSNTLVVIDAPSTVKQITSLVEKLDSPTRTKIFELNHAKAKDLQERIKEMLTKGVGSMQTDERTNKLVITDLEPNLVKIEN